MKFTYVAENFYNLVCVVDSLPKEEVILTYESFNCTRTENVYLNKKKFWPDEADTCIWLDIKV